MSSVASTASCTLSGVERWNSRHVSTKASTASSVCRLAVRLPHLAKSDIRRRLSLN